jgi:mono/diheme cytochrome c family protein
MMRVLKYLVILGIVGAGVAWFLTAPKYITEADLPDHSPDAVHGERVFWTGGCVSCHAAPEAEGDDVLVLTGGLAFKTDFGTFYAPNISTDPEFGIGGWSMADLVSAMKYGSSPGGVHYYPAFPYTSYTRMELTDIMDLKAFMDTLPASDNQPPAHEVGFPFNIRRSLGGWKLLNLSDDWVIEVSDEKALRGREIVEGAGHCSECHTPRNAIGALKKDQWLAGGPNPEGEGRIPNITPSDDGIGSWTEEDIVYYLETGFTPDFDSVGGAMVDVVSNISKLPAEDREAIATYLKAVPPLPSNR